MTPEGGVFSEPLDTESSIEPVLGDGTTTPQPSPLGAGFLILVTRELNGLSQRALAGKPDRPRPDPSQIEALGFDLLGILRHNPQDDLADFDVLREPHPWEGPEHDTEAHA